MTATTHRLLDRPDWRASARWLALIALAAVTLAGCGKSAESTPTALPPTAALSVQPTATTPASAPTVAAVPASGSAAAASPGPGEQTVGQIADGIAAAWGSVRTYRTTTTSLVVPVASPVALGSPIPVATPIAASAVNTTIADYLLPDRRHLVQLQDQQPLVEIIVIGGTIYARGTQVPGFPSVADPNAWFVVDPAALGTDSPFAETYATLTKPLTPPYAGLSAAERSRIAHPEGAIPVDGRSCRAFRTVDTTQTGERIDVTITIDDTGLPCSIETRSGSSDTVTTFAYNLDLTIDPPL